LEISEEVQGSLPGVRPISSGGSRKEHTQVAVVFPITPRLSAKHKGGEEEEKRSSIPKNKASATLLEDRPGTCKEETKHVAACRNEKASHTSVGEHAQSR
jgi:hypothetical protein